MRGVLPSFGRLGVVLVELHTGSRSGIRAEVERGASVLSHTRFLTDLQDPSQHTGPSAREQSDSYLTDWAARLYVSHALPDIAFSRRIPHG